MSCASTSAWVVYNITRVSFDVCAILSLESSFSNRWPSSINTLIGAPEPSVGESSINTLSVGKDGIIIVGTNVELTIPIWFSGLTSNLPSKPELNISDLTATSPKNMWPDGWTKSFTIER